MPSYKIMIVEDEEIVAADIQASVENMGHSVCAMASSGMEAIKKAELAQPDLVLMDIVLKGSMDGIEAAVRIKELYKIPVVYLTAFGDDGMLQQAKIAEPYGYITKPFRDRDLQIAIEISIYRKQTEARIQKMERWLATVLRSIGDAVIASDKETRITFMNSVAETLTGWNQEDALGKKLTEVLNIKDQDLSDLEKYLVEKVISEGLIINLIKDRLLVAKNGKEIPISDSAAPITDDNGEAPGSVLVFRDITERKRAEEENAKLEGQLRQAQKMESVGRLAGGVAHDFNNMLTLILGHVEIAIEQVDPAQPLHAHLQEIRKATERSSDLTRQLLTFARKQTIAPKVLDLNKTVAGMLKMLKRLIGEDIELNWQPEPGLLPVKMDPTQIDQILVNLFVNARDAICGIGTVTIATANSAFDAARCASHAGYIPGEYVQLSVSDDGCGMDKETLSHLFEPFFTTKEIGKGTGLGLATVYGIVKQNKGFIDVYSEPGQGTAFKIYLPRHVGKAEQAQTESMPVSALPGQEAILLVEDEPDILSLTKMLLERQGYTVFAAGTPGEAIRMAREYVGEIHLLMTDVVMPEMNGRDLAKNLLSLYPNLKRLFMSGYTANVIAHHGVLDEGVHFIQKPFSIKDLAAKVRETLDSE